METEQSPIVFAPPIQAGEMKDDSGVKEEVYDLKETMEDSPVSVLKSKCDDKEHMHEEDIVDGFAFISYKSWGQLQEILDEEDMKRREEEEKLREEEEKAKAEVEMQRLQRAKLLRPTPKKAKRNKENMITVGGTEETTSFAHSPQPGSQLPLARVIMNEPEGTLDTTTGPPATKIPKLEIERAFSTNSLMSPQSNCAPADTTSRLDSIQAVPKLSIFSPQKNENPTAAQPDSLTHPVDPGHRPVQPAPAPSHIGVPGAPPHHPGPLSNSLMVSAAALGMGLNRSINSMAPPNANAFPFLSPFSTLPSALPNFGIPPHLIPGMLGGAGGIVNPPFNAPNPSSSNMFTHGRTQSLQSSHKNTPQKRQGKWCAMHVRIAWDIEKRKKERPEKEKERPSSSQGSATKPSTSNTQETHQEHDKPLPLLTDKAVERHRISMGSGSPTVPRSTPSVIQNGSAHGRESVGGRPHSSHKGRGSHTSSVTSTPAPLVHTPHSTSRRSSELLHQSQQLSSNSRNSELQISCGTPRLTTPSRNQSFGMDPGGLLAMGLRPPYPQMPPQPPVSFGNMVDSYTMAVRQRQMEMGQNQEREDLLRRQNQLAMLSRAGVAPPNMPGLSMDPNTSYASLEMEIERQRLLYAMTNTGSNLLGSNNFPNFMDPLRLGAASAGYGAPGIPPTPFYGSGFMPNQQQQGMDSLFSRSLGLGGVGGLPLSNHMPPYSMQSGMFPPGPPLIPANPYANPQQAMAHKSNNPFSFSNTLEHLARQKRDHLGGPPSESFR